MKIGVMLSDITRSLFKKPITEPYPFKRKPAPEHLRSSFHWDQDKCTGCLMCVRDCPSEALDLTIIDRKSKRFVMHYQVDRCIFCGQCVHSCNFSSISMTGDKWEHASLNTKAFDIMFGREEDVQSVLANESQTNAEGTSAA